MSDKERIEQPEDDVTPEDVLGALPEDEPDVESGGTDEAAEGEPTEDVAGDEAAEAEGEEASGAEAEEPAETAEPGTPADDGLTDYVVRYGGQEFQVRVTPEQAKILEAQNTTALQFPHLQRKYQEAVQQPRQVPQPVAGEPAQQFQPDAFVARMKPEMDAAVKRGAISEDFAELYPVEAASLVWAGHLADQLVSAVGTMGQHYAETTHEAEVREFTAEVYGQMQSLADSSPDVFGDLATPQNKESFLNFMIETNLEVDSLRGERARDTLSRMYAAWMGPKLTAAAEAAAKRVRAEEAEARRNARGGGGGAAPRSKPEDNLKDIREILG